MVRYSLFLPPAIEGHKDNIQTSITTTEDQYSPDFNDDSADITLVASDGVRFRIYSNVLKTSSVFFKDMLSLPRTKHEDDIVSVDETGATLDTLLRMVSGMNFDVPQTDDALMAIILAATKYGMRGAFAIAKTWILLPTVKLNPLRLFNIGCRMGIPELEAEGLRRSLEIDIQDAAYQPYLEELDTRSLLQIMKLRRLRVEIMDDFFELILKGSSQSICWIPKHADSATSFPSCKLCTSSTWRRTELSMKTHIAAAAEGSWRALQRRVMVELTRDPSGAKLTSGDFANWPEVKHLHNTPECGSCGSLAPAQLMVVISKTVADLPTTLDYSSDPQPKVYRFPEYL